MGELTVRQQARFTLLLMEHMDDRPWRLQSWLLNFARPGQESGDHDSYNPIRRIAGVLGVRIQDHLIAKYRAAALTKEGRSDG